MRHPPATAGKPLTRLQVLVLATAVLPAQRLASFVPSGYVLSVLIKSFSLRVLGGRRMIVAGEGGFKMMMMNRRLPLALFAALALVSFQALAQTPGGQPPRSTADPYANNPDAGKMQFPLAAPAGKD